jgi:3-methylfumaryl-CoA hydratase
MGKHDDWIGRFEIADDIATELVACRMAGLRAETVRRGEPWPAARIWVLFWRPLRHADAGPDGHAARGGFMPPVDLPRRMWAGSTVTVEKPILVGDAVGRTSTITDISEKTGRSGAPSTMRSAAPTDASARRSA